MGPHQIASRPCRRRRGQRLRTDGSIRQLPEADAGSGTVIDQYARRSNQGRSRAAASSSATFVLQLDVCAEVVVPPRAGKWRAFDCFRVHRLADARVVDASDEDLDRRCAISSSAGRTAACDYPACGLLEIGKPAEGGPK